MIEKFMQKRKSKHKEPGQEMRDTVDTFSMNV